jgi:glycosyltransferase involved in cell wall biosynthesis
VELTDLWPEVLIDFGILSRRNPVTWALRAIEKFLYRKAQRIIMIWPRTQEYVQGLGISADKVVWIPHLADLSRYENMKPYDGAIRGRFTVMYLGSFVSFMAMEVILDAARVLQDRGRSDIRFVLIGGGTDEFRLRRYAAELSVNNVEFQGLVPKKEISTVMSAADAFVVSLKDVPHLRYGISLNKMCDYLASGRPTVLAGNPGYDPIKEANAGFSVPAEKPLELASAIEALMALTPDERVSLGLNGIEYLRRVHGVDLLTDRLEAAILGIAGNGASGGNVPTAGLEVDANSVYETHA